MRNMNSKLISDPFLFPPSGEDPTREDGYGNGGPRFKSFREDFVNYTKNQFELEWENASLSSGSYLFDISDHNYAAPNPNIRSPTSYYPSPPTTPNQDFTMDLSTMSMDLDTLGLNELLNFNSSLDGSSESSQPLEHNFLTTSPALSPTTDFLGGLLEDDKFYEALGLSEPGLDKKQIEGLIFADTEDSLLTTRLTELAAPLMNPSSMTISPVPLIHDHSVAVYPEETGDSMLPSKRNTRKSSLTARHASASPSMEFGSSSSEVKIPKTRSRSIKQEELKPVVKKSLKRESLSPVSAAAGIAEERKRQKMYERKDDPACKNAKAARANREKKKELMDKLQHENTELTLANEKNAEKLNSLERSNQQLKEELEKMKQTNRAATGLKRILTSAKSLLEDIMPPLIKKHGRWTIEAAPWLSQVDIENTDENHTSLTASMENPTSEYITLHVNVPKRIVKVDYRHEDPILPNVMPL